MERPANFEAIREAWVRDEIFRKRSGSSIGHKLTNILRWSRKNDAR